MIVLESMALRHDGTTLWILDQTLLPHQEQWMDASLPTVMVDCIQRLAVRGAPLIGVAAALSAATLAERGAPEADLRAALASLRRARPTAVNLMLAVDRLVRVLDAGGSAADLVAEAVVIFQEDVQLCEALATQGASLIQPGEALLTHCNAGALATAGIGTAVGVIRRAWEQGKVRHVYVDETRPLLQGARLTAWELQQLGIPYTLLTDSMAALVLRDGAVQRIFVGADRISRNGDVANKVGTYGLAVQARFHGVPFHPVAPWTTVDPACPDGSAIPIEQRASTEVRGQGDRVWAPDGGAAYNPSFDVTPHTLITSLVLDSGVIPGATLPSGAWIR